MSQQACRVALAVALSLCSLEKQRCSVPSAVSSGAWPKFETHVNHWGLDCRVCHPRPDIWNQPEIKFMNLRGAGRGVGGLTFLWSRPNYMFCNRPFLEGRWQNGGMWCFLSAQVHRFVRLGRCFSIISTHSWAPLSCEMDKWYVAGFIDSNWSAVDLQQ